MTAELTELSELHLAYEKAFGPAEDEANNLSEAVGRFLRDRGYDGRGRRPAAVLSLRERLALLLSDFDANGLQPTTGELDVILEVIASVERTGAEWQETSQQPTTWRYAVDAERALNARRKADWTDA